MAIPPSNPHTSPGNRNHRGLASPVPHLYRNIGFWLSLITKLHHPILYPSTLLRPPPLPYPRGAQSLHPTQPSTTLPHLTMHDHDASPKKSPNTSPTCTENCCRHKPAWLRAIHQLPPRDARRVGSSTLHLQQHQLQLPPTLPL